MKYVGCGESAIALRNNNNHLSLFELVGCKKHPSKNSYAQNYNK